MIEQLIISLKSLVLVLCAMDLGLTALYLNKYKKYQPEMPIERIEANIIIRKTTKNFNLNFALIISSLLIFCIVWGIVSISHWALCIFYLIIYGAAIHNHIKNIKILKRLMKKFPKGFIEKKDGSLVSK